VQKNLPPKISEIFPTFFWSVCRLITPELKRSICDNICRVDCECIGEPSNPRWEYCKLVEKCKTNKVYFASKHGKADRHLQPKKSHYEDIKPIRYLNTQKKVILERCLMFLNHFYNCLLNKYSFLFDCVFCGCCLVAFRAEERTTDCIWKCSDLLSNFIWWPLCWFYWTIMVWVNFISIHVSNTKHC